MEGAGSKYNNSNLKLKIKKINEYNFFRKNTP